LPPDVIPAPAGGAAAPTGAPAAPAGGAPAAPVDAGQNQLAHGVFGFFNNGGTRCYVMRYPDMGALRDPQNLAPLEAIDEISLVAAPGITDAGVLSNIVTHCTNMGDRFAILEAPEKPPGDALTESGIKVAFDTTRAADGSITSTPSPIHNTDYGALYFPWIRVFDRATQVLNPEGDGDITVGPSGHVAGIYSRVDHERGVHKAPANEVVRGALGTAYRISRNLQDGLNPGGVNCIREINDNITVWGARTIGGDKNTDLKYINVRRTLIFLRKSIDQGTQWVVFEPNDRSLWAKIVRNVTAFLTVVWRDGALFGSSPQEAFYVKCDDETNPPENRDLGRVTTEIGVAIVRPAEFVIFRISQWAGPTGQ
jgi:phage tail sheath protein FI